MGTNLGGGMGLPGGGEMPNMMPQNVSNQPHATEYTLQGVMRFLQTEWHRHERDRNSWEIEKQEMKGRIASLEGAGRRADATQKALRKYVTILEKKVKDQAAQLKGSASAEANANAHAAPPETSSEKSDRAAKVQEKLRSSTRLSETGEDMEGIDLQRSTDDEGQRSELKAFLDQCQAEFTYLMITPANPLPPRESPPLPLLDELGENEAYGIPSTHQQLEQYSQQLRPAPNHLREVAARSHGPSSANQHPAAMASGPVDEYAVKRAEAQSAAMVRSGGEVGSLYGGVSDWPSRSSVRHSQESVPEQNHVLRIMNRSENDDILQEKKVIHDPDAWDFGQGTIDVHNATQSASAAPNRPDTDVFPAAESVPKSPNRGPTGHRRKSSMSRRRSAEHELSLSALAQKADSGNFKLRFGLRGHLDTVRTVIFSGGGSPGEPEICTAGDDGLIKRFHIPRAHSHVAGPASDLDVQADFTHRGHNGAVLSLASWSSAPNFSTGGRAQGDGWIFSGGQDASIRVWERGRVDPKDTIDGHTDAVWALCVLPATLGSVFGPNSAYGSPDRILLASGAADGTVRVWAVSAPPQLSSPQPNAMSGRRGGSGRVRGNSMSSGSAFPNSPQPTIASNSPFHYTLVHNIPRPSDKASPTCITALSGNGGAFVVSYSDATIIVYDTRTGEEIGSMASLETYDGTVSTSVNSIVATSSGLEQPQLGDEDSAGSGPTGGGRTAGSGIEGVIISGHEDQFVRFFDANSGQCTYNMLAHPAAISSLSLSPDGRELVSAGHDASLRFWNLEKRACSQEITSHRIMRGEGVCAVVWSQDGRWVVSGGGDGVVKVFAR